MALQQSAAQTVESKYQFEPTPEWLEHLQKASVRFNSGGSGSFGSANGLVIINHDVGADTLQKISTQQHNYLRDGFYAKTLVNGTKLKDVAFRKVRNRKSPLCGRRHE